MSSRARDPSRGRTEKQNTKMLRGSAGPRVRAHRPRKDLGGAARLWPRFILCLVGGEQNVRPGEARPAGSLPGMGGRGRGRGEEGEEEGEGGGGGRGGEEEGRRGRRRRGGGGGNARGGGEGRRRGRKKRRGGGGGLVLQGRGA